MSLKSDTWQPETLRSVGRLDLIAKIVLEGVKDGMHRGIRHGFSSEFYDYQQYQWGEDASKVDWRLYARTRKLFIKRFEAETSLECIVMLDQSPSMNWRWQENINKREYCAALAASLSLLFIQQRDHVGLLTFGDAAPRFTPPKSSRQHFNSLLGALSEKGVGESERSLKANLESWRGVRRHRGLLILFSDLEFEREELIECLKSLRGSGDEVILFHVLDHAEIKLPFGNVTHLTDSETGELLAVDIQELRREQGARIAGFRDFLQTQSRNGGVTYVPLDTSVSYVDAILAMAQKRIELI